MTFAIRTARASDALGIAGVAVASICGLGANFYDAGQIEAWSAAFTPESVQASFVTGITWVADEGGEIVGFAKWEPPSEFDLLYVHPNAAGTGVARALSHALESAAIDAGVFLLEATVSRSARAAFDSFGYELVEEAIRLLGGQSFSVARMRKNLDE
ncbi:MAG: GNAT family N-acetyltransferase [Actinomycetes bacterium]